MFRSVTFFAVLCCLFNVPRLNSQSDIPAGVTVPVMLSTTIRPDKTKAGEPIKGRIMQDVPLPGGGKLSRGSNVIGQIVEINPTEVTLSFDRLQVGKHEVPIRTSLRAIASMLVVQDARIPTNAAADRGNPPSMWNTQQIGGRDVVYGRPGDVLNGSERVGKSLGDGSVFEILSPNLNGRCEGDSKQLRAVWVFSSSACGTYGFADLQVEHFGETEPAGYIVLRSTTQVEIRSGSGLLLQVLGR